MRTEFAMMLREFISAARSRRRAIDLSIRLFGLNKSGFFFFQAEDGIRDLYVTEFRRVLFRSELFRDGSPTELTKKLYPRLLGDRASAKDRLELNAYLLAGITEYWRAYRQYAGVLHFVYLTGSDPGGYTADHFRDVEKLELNPEFFDYMSNAFAPL